MNNPHKLPPEDRAITPKPLFNKGINCFMSKERRAAKQARHRKNASARRDQSSGVKK